MVGPWNKILIDSAGAAHPVLAALALFAGLLILLVGWRISGLVAVLNLSVIGLAMGALLFPWGDMRWIAGGVGAVGLGVAAACFQRYGVMATCGAIGGACVLMLGMLLNASILLSLILALLVFVGTIGACLIAYEQVSAVMLAVQGGVLTVFGVTGCLASVEQVWPIIQDLFGNSGVAAGVLVVTTVVVGALFQLSAIQNDSTPAT